MRVLSFTILSMILLSSLSLSGVLCAQELAGVIDFHAHSDPDSVPRSIDALDLARLAKSQGMRGLVLKNHFEPTASLAYVVRKEVPGIEAFGGIALDLPVGGLNPEAIEKMASVKGGWGRVVWLPTVDSENDVRRSKENRPFVSVVRDGKITPEVVKVLTVIARRDLVLETGHSSAQESLVIIREARQRGIKRIVVTHAMSPGEDMTVPQMQEAAKMGAYLELVANGLFMNPPREPDIHEIAAAIKAVGPEHCILASDLGRADLPLHPEGLKRFFDGLLKQGLKQSEIDVMAKVNPAKLLGLGPA